MAIQWKRNSRYPSVTRPGVFPRIQELDSQGVDLLAETWENLTGIDEEEMNKFKFSLGTWVQFSRRNREIIVLSSEAANKITFAITSDLEEGQTEPKPNYLPNGYVADIHNWAKEGETDANGGFIYILHESLDSEGEGKWRFGYGGGNKTQEEVEEEEGNKYDGQSLANKSSDEPYTLIDHRRYQPGFWSQPKWYEHIKNGGFSPAKYWKVSNKKKEKKGNLGNKSYQVRLYPNVEDSIFADVLARGEKSQFAQWQWKPLGKKITDPETGLSAFGEWIKGGALVITENQASSDNRYVGLVTTRNVELVEDIEEGDLFIYHELESDNYKNISAPLEVFFSMNFFEVDEDNSRRGFNKYLILEWGDENEKLSDENILNSEFFYIYETEDTTFDYVKYKKLCLLIEDADEMSLDPIDEYIQEGDIDSINRGKIHSHVYTDPGIYTIKSIVFRMSTDGAALLESYIVHTNIFVADPNQKIQNFNIFGGEDFTVLPMEEEFEPIIGNIDKRSEYVKSVEKIRNNDLYEGSDYLEKMYADDFLPKVNQDLYGEYAGNIDLGITRVFKKTYNIFDFIGGDALEIINNNFEYPQDSLPLNSSATEILIDDGDCVVELNPNNQNNNQVENTGISDEKGVMMGDYRLVKNPNQKIKKEDAMQLPKLNTQKKRQAF